MAETVRYLKEYLLDSMVEDEVMEQEAVKGVTSISPTNRKPR